MEQSFKQFGAWGTKFKNKIFRDEFLLARIKLTFVYFLTAVAILGVSSLILYKLLFSQLAESVIESNLSIRETNQLLDHTQDNLQYKIAVVDGSIIIFVIGLGFLVTAKTLKPIKKNMLMQKRFIADASHEMRTPVTVVISGLEVALRNKHLDLDMAKKTIESTLEEMREFSKLSNDLLNVSKYATHSKKPFQKLGIQELITSIAKKMEPLAEEKQLNIILELSTQTILSGDSIELSRVFYNILMNAITHTEKGSITIAEKSIDDTYYVRIIDTGEGIASDMVSKLFDPFFRGETSRTTSGAGLGLTLAKKIIEHHGGTIDITSEIDHGTTVSIALPISS